MEALTRLVADSLARHGLDRPIDPSRLQWSRWFRCDSAHSLLVVPSKPGLFAIAEEVLGGGLQRCDSIPGWSAASPAEVPFRRMLAVRQFCEDGDMAFTLDRMFARMNPMRARLASGGCFVRFVVIEDQDQRRSICTVLNQWLLSSAEKATGLPQDFSSSLELADGETHNAGADGVGRALPSVSSRQASSANLNAGTPSMLSSPSTRNTNSGNAAATASPHLDSGAAKNFHCPHPLPSGF